MKLLDLANKSQKTRRTRQDETVDEREGDGDEEEERQYHDMKGRAKQDKQPENTFQFRAQT